MWIEKDSITHLASEGYLTLQVPTLYVMCAPDKNKMINAPDDWFCWLKNQGSGYVPCVGKQKGLLFLTKKGFRANYNDLKKAFEQAIANGKDRTNGVGWPAFVKHANDHFADIQARINKMANKKQNEMNQLNGFVV